MYGSASIWSLGETRGQAPSLGRAPVQPPSTGVTRAAACCGHKQDQQQSPWRHWLRGVAVLSTGAVNERAANVYGLG